MGYAGRTGSSPRGGLTDQALGENNRGTGGKAAPSTMPGSGFGIGGDETSKPQRPKTPVGTIPGRRTPTPRPPLVSPGKTAPTALVPRPGTRGATTPTPLVPRSGTRTAGSTRTTLYPSTSTRRTS